MPFADGGGCMECQLTASGHAHVRGTHGSTLELTTEEWLTPAGDCIIGVDASHSCATLPAVMRSKAQSETTHICVELTVPGIAPVTVRGRGDPGLRWADPTSMVIRTSTYIDDRTLMVDADCAAADLPRPLVSALADGTSLSATVRVTD